MNGAERHARLVFLRTWYSTAAPIWNPPDARFVVLSARKNTSDIVSITESWLNTRFGYYRVPYFILLPMPRTIRNVVAWKAERIRECGLTDFTEDNPRVVSGLRKALPEVRVWLFDPVTQIRRL